MDHWGIVREAWAVTRRERGLWGFGAIAAAQGLVVSVVIGLTAALFGFAVAFTQVVAAANAGAVEIAPFVDQSAVLMSSIFEQYGSLFIVALVALFALWVVLAIIDVAGFGGLVHQLDAVASGEPAAFREGLSVGWRVWWRTASLYAIAVAPALVLLFIDTLMLVLPMLRVIETGEPPDLAIVFAGLQAQQPISLLISLASIPLVVVLALSYRYAIVMDMPWRPALAAGWHLVKRHVGDVAVFYLVMTLVVSLVAAAFGFIVGLLVAVAGGTVVLSVVGGAGSVALVFGVIAIVIAGVMLYAELAVVNLFANAGWSLLWRRLIALPATAAGAAASLAAQPASSDDATPPPPLALDGVPPASPITERGHV